MESVMARVIEEGAPRPHDNSLIVGATRLGWLYGKSRKWGARMLKMWAREQDKGGPIRVFLGVGGGLYTTMAIVHQYMPPGRDIALYRRVEAIESDIADAHRRIDREVIRAGDVERRLAKVEARIDRKAS
jgi:hypothetical protein